ncbi:hypothetical protein [Ottowia sp. SB7-C50]|uniref:hypothetical protein n=1 Tax=Ottowia sp. SB7-C50 TaxID=3081231 RepID=UPI0029543E8A|nr:hypothetical protein [Ottowia sp. SB7-C50]WOP14631.1 hypothetical protein R0D99_12345 [Ottowia sp. SB7-C50]
MGSTHDAHCLAIGRMIVAFQSLEATLKSELTLLMNNQLETPGGQLTYAMVAELPFRVTVRLAAALPGVFTLQKIVPVKPESEVCLNQLFAETADLLEKGLKMAGEVEERRNQVVHSHWFLGSGYVAPEGTMTRMKTKTKKGAVATTFDHETLADLNSIAESAEEAQRLIGMALRDYRQIAQAQW